MFHKIIINHFATRFSQARKIVVTFFILLSVMLLASCLHTAAPTSPAVSRKELSRARAIEIARSQVKFQPQSIKAEKIKENGRRLWRVTFRGEPVGEVNPMGEILIVSLDRVTGEIVSIAQS
ncbi:MAG: PepSY domain-containing protein [Acidobacteria bacterium]|nr:PepSY domain-containing protein [Acidobacteriota bacterium]